MQDNFNPNKIFARKLELTNAGNLPLVDKVPEVEAKVSLLPDATISPAKFKKHPQFERVWYAHPQTIRAVRPDVFVLGEEGMEDFIKVVECEKCRAELDLQFWKHCPYCETFFAKELLSNINLKS